MEKGDVVLYKRDLSLGVVKSINAAHTKAFVYFNSGDTAQLTDIDDVVAISNPAACLFIAQRRAQMGLENLPVASQADMDKLMCEVGKLGVYESDNTAEQVEKVCGVMGLCMQLLKNLATGASS